jgi:hypothetical protein
LTSRTGSFSAPFDLDLPMRRGAHRIHQLLTGTIAGETTKLFPGDHDDFVAPAHRDVLRAFAADQSDELAEASLRVM